MKTKQLPNDFRDWISSRTFVIGVQGAVAPGLHTDGGDDVGGGSELDLTLTRGQGYVALSTVASVIFIRPGP